LLSERESPNCRNPRAVAVSVRSQAKDPDHYRLAFARAFALKPSPMRAAIAGAAVLIAASLCFGQESKTYSASEAAKHVGETATVVDKVANVFESKVGNVFLNFGARYPKQVFTAFIPKDSTDKFPSSRVSRVYSITSLTVTFGVSESLGVLIFFGRSHFRFRLRLT
jgi:hypothetical protein